MPLAAASLQQFGNKNGRDHQLLENKHGSKL
jgi:hypothetical protein